MSAAGALHASLALLSVALFVGRFLWRASGRPIASRTLRITPHVLDTLLVATGIWLFWHFGHSLLHWYWLTAKLTAVVLYIVLAFIAYRQLERHVAHAWLLFIAALSVVTCVPWLAIARPAFG